jgi:hypothetical protein
VKSVDTSNAIENLPLVSVVIPCYNYGHYLPNAVRSVLEQHGVDLEIIIVDDASTDGSQIVARDLAAGDNRIRLIQHEQNRGHIATYNDGLATVTGDYVVLLSADDLLAPGSLERSTGLMRRNPSVGLVYGFSPDFSDEPPAAKRVRASYSTWKGDAWLARICERGTNLIVNPEAILRRDIMDALVGYSTDLPQTADMELWMRAAARADVGRVNGPDQGYYRVHTANMHLSDFSGLLTDMRARRETFARFFRGPGADLSRAMERLEQAHRTISREAAAAAILALGRDGVMGGAQASDFADFAVETWPGISETRVWRRYVKRRARPTSSLHVALEERIAYARVAVRWRRWRRFGV